MDRSTEFVGWGSYRPPGVTEKQDGRFSPPEFASAKGRKIGICGQAPSDYSEFAQFLVERGIDSISLNPDSLLKTLVTIIEREQKLRQAR